MEVVPLDTKALELLEFPKIRERLAAFTSFSGGRELALSLVPSADQGWVTRSHREWSEAKLLLELQPNYALGGVHDVRAIAEQAALGGLLTPDQLLDVRDTLHGARTLRDTLSRFQDRLPVLWEQAHVLPDARAVEEETNRCIGPRSEVLDGASPLLARLRVEVRQAHDRLVARLNDLLASQRLRGILQEPLITLRSGRYVVPVKADFRGEFRGIVHDLSTSGATVFMEPLETLDLGNTWRQLQIEEEREVERVLRRLSLLVGDYSQEIQQTVAILAQIDLALAKARYAHQVQGIAPEVLAPAETTPDLAASGRPTMGPLKLVQARHPLLAGHVVPLSLELGEDFYALVITGPNTGGKTVALKTVGLLVLMAEAGVPVPAAEGTQIPLYREVLADIGDEQSIEQSLSTFSSHMSNIIRILVQAQGDSLVLLDELSAGTDPTEGSALGRAILQHLLQRGVTTVATTHHSDLKAYAYSTPGVRNASVEFDAETLAPTYRLTVGLPGRSNAIAIAQHLGLAQELVEAARGFLEPDKLQVENLLSQIQQEKDAAASLRREAEELRRQAEATGAAWAALLQKLETEKEDMLEAAGRELTVEAEAIKDRLRQAAREIDLALREQRRERLMAAAQALQETEEQLASPRGAAAPRRRRPAPRGRPPELAPGARVRLKGLDQTAEIVAIPPSPEGEVEVQIGAFRAKVKPEQLEAPDGPGPAAAPDRSFGWTFSSGSFSNPGSEAAVVESEVQLRGVRVEEALVRLEDYLDDAFRAGLPWVRIIHGKGTGTMRRAVREALARHPLVRSFESPPQEQGGEGVTVAYLVQ